MDRRLPSSQSDHASITICNPHHLLHLPDFYVILPLRDPDDFFGTQPGHPR